MLLTNTSLCKASSLKIYTKRNLKLIINRGKKDSLVDNPDQIKWNEKYSKILTEKYSPHPILDFLEKSSFLPPTQPNANVLELACGLSGNVLSLASLGYNVLAVDISDVALNSLASIVKKNKLESKVNLLLEDLKVWQIPEETFSLVLGLKYWDKACFTKASKSLIKGGVIAWETFNKKHLCYYPDFRSEWCLEDKEPSKLLTNKFEILVEKDFDDGKSSTRRFVAKRL